MTHDELLKKLTPSLTYSPNMKFGAIRVLNSLRAVVELHKPSIHALPDETCWACQDLYPCPTIQAIEKELT